jgi:hypothetical protein
MEFRSPTTHAQRIVWVNGFGVGEESGMRRLKVSVGTMALLCVAVTACANNAPTTSGTDGTGGVGVEPQTSKGPDGTGGLGAGPSASASPAAGPGSKGTPSKAGYVWGYDPAGESYVVAGDYRYNSSGGPITISRLGTGYYRVTFAGLGEPGGVAHATAYGANANFCAVVRWQPSGADENVEVKCWDRGTSEVDTTFVANFAAGSQAGAAFSYLWADGGNRTGRYIPVEQYRFDSTGQAPWVERTGTGHYKVYLPASRDIGGEPFTFQVSAYGPVTARCKVSRVKLAPGTHEVVCHDAQGTPFDAKFSLSFSSQGSFIGRTDRRYGEYTYASPGVANPSMGVYTVPAKEMGQPRGQVVAYATRDSSTYCHVASWAVAGKDLSMTVHCFSANGDLAASQFMLGVTW